MSHVMQSELGGREFGFILPDGSRVVGERGGRHGELAVSRFKVSLPSEREYGLESFFLALEAGWVRYSVGPRHCVVGLLDEPSARQRAAAFILERAADDTAVTVRPPGPRLRAGALVTAHFGPDYRAATRWTVTGALPSWAINCAIHARDGWAT